MKTKRNFTRAEVTRKQEKRIREGHPWIYEDEITVMDTPEGNGCLIDVFSSKGTYLGTGMYSEHSKIRIRLLGNNANEQYNDAFFLRRLKYALEYRMDVMGEDFANSRLIHGEADGLPGVTVDKYGPVLVSEISTYGMDIRKDLLYRGMKELLAEKGYEVSGIYERSDSELRTKEGLAKFTGWVTEYTEKEIPVQEINENGIFYDVDIINGQKTGFFLDQKYNRLSVRKLAAGKNVLDCCTHTGSFAINAAYGKAAQVTALDVSETALDMARQNAWKNHLEEKINFVQADVFEYLETCLRSHTRYDFIVLDPPAFTKSRSTVRNASHGYERINTLAMRILPRGGYLATCSCSHFMSTEMFREMLAESARKAGVTIRIIEENHASPDHPRLMNVPETDYLKFFLIQVI